MHIVPPVDQSYTRASMQRPGPQSCQDTMLPCQVVEDSRSRAEGWAGRWTNPSSSKTEWGIVKQIYLQLTYFVDAHLFSIFSLFPRLLPPFRQGVWESLSPLLANCRAPTPVAAGDTTSPYVDGDPHDGISVKRTLKSCWLLIEFSRSWALAPSKCANYFFECISATIWQQKTIIEQLNLVKPSQVQPQLQCIWCVIDTKKTWGIPITLSSIAYAG